VYYPQLYGEDLMLWLVTALSLSFQEEASFFNITVKDFTLEHFKSMQ